MKNRLLALAMLLCLCGITEKVAAQNVDLTVMYGYTFNDRFDVYEGYGEVSDGGLFTGILSFGLNPNYDIELYYSRQNAKFDFNYYYDFNGINTNGIIRDEPASVNYIQIGGCRNKALDPVGKATAFGGLNLGAVGIVPEDGKYDDVWKFALGIKAGIKYFFSEKVGMRIQTQLQMPVLYTAGSIWVGTGGASVGMSGGSTITQFGFSGGLIYRLK